MPALAVALAWAPGALLAPALARQSGRTTRALLALVLSPFLAGTFSCLLLVLGVAPAAAARTVLLAIAALAVWSARRPAAPADDDAGAARAAQWAAAAAWCAIVAAFLLGNRAVMTRSDAGFHAALTLQVAARGLPPEDPFFAGFPLFYFWGTHAWAALWLGAAPSAPVWAPLVTLNLAGAAATLLGVGAIARRLGADHRGVWAAAAAAVLGYAPLGWRSIVGRAFTGDVQGWEEIRRLVDLGGATTIGIMSWGTLHGSLAFFGDKFLVLTPFALGMAAFAAMVVAWLDLVARPSGRAAVAFALVAAAALFTHTLAGWFGLLAAGGCWLWALVRARRPAEAGLRGVLVPAALAIGAPVVALAPYLAATTFGRMGGGGAGFSPLAFGSWLIAGAALVPASALWLARVAPQPGGARELAPWVLMSSVLALGLGLPTTNQAKLFNLLFLLLAAPAALGWLALHDRLPRLGRGALVAALAIAVLPTAGLAFWGFALEPGAQVESWQRVTPAEREALDWIRDHTPPDAVCTDRGASQNFAVLAGRSVLYGGAEHRTGWGLPATDLETRGRAAAALAELRDPPPALEPGLRALGREILVVVRRRDGAEAWDRTAAHFRELYRNAEIAVFRWEPPSP